MHLPDHRQQRLPLGFFAGHQQLCVFERQGANRYLRSFVIGDGEIDGTYETDGIEISAANFGGALLQRLFVAQDGANMDKEVKAQPQNFKLVPGKEVIKAIEAKRHRFRAVSFTKR